MHPDPYRDLTAAFGHLTRRPPAWTRHPALRRHGDLDGLVTAIRDDHPDPTASDNLLRILTALRHETPDAATVVVYALAEELRMRLSRAATAEYRVDALGELAAVVLEGDTAGDSVGHRWVNRAHNRMNKHHHRVRHHGRAVPSTVDPLPPDRVTDYRDQQLAQRDIADEVAARVDLERFGDAIAGAIAAGNLAETTWTTYADHRLSVIYLPDRPPVATRHRVAAYRAAKKLQPIIDSHLRGHAA